MAASDRVPNLSTTQLAYLAAVTEHPTWRAAAASLGVTQSALSQGLAELERRLGLELFEWHGRRRVLRPEARQVASFANGVLGQTRDLARWIGELSEGRAGRLHVGMIDAAAVHHFFEVLQAFRSGHGDVDLHLTVSASGQLLADLADGRLDLAVCVAPTRPPSALDTVALLNEPMALYRPPGHGAAREAGNPAAIGQPTTWGPWVTFPANSHTRHVIERAVRALGAPWTVVAESHQPEVLREMVRLGLGWAVLPISQAESAPHPLQRARSEPIAERTLMLARRLDRLPNRAADTLTEMLTDAARAGSPPRTKHPARARSDQTPSSDAQESISSAQPATSKRSPRSKSSRR